MNLNLSIFESPGFRNSLIICLCVILFFIAFIPVPIVQRGDFTFHYEKALNNGANSDRKEAIEAYAPLGAMLSGPFTYNMPSFYYFMLILLALVTPMLLYFFAKRWLVVPLYFCCSYYFYFMFMTISQALAGILLLLLLLNKNNLVRCVILLIAIMAHSQGFPLIAFSFAMLLLFENLKLDGIREKFMRIFPGCSGVFGTARPDALLDTSIAGHENWGLRVGTIFEFFFKTIPFPFFAMGLWQHIKERRFELLAIAAFGMVAIVEKAARASYIVPLVILPGAARFYSKEWKLRYKLAYFGMMAAFGIFEFVAWYNIKVLC